MAQILVDYWGCEVPEFWFNFLNAFFLILLCCTIYRIFVIVACLFNK